MASISELNFSSSQRKTLLVLQMRSLSSISFSLRQYSLLSSPTMPTLDSDAKIFLARTFSGNGVGWYFTNMPEQNTLSLSVRKISELEDTSASTIFSPLKSSSWVRAKEVRVRSLSTRGLVLAPNTPPLLTPRQQRRPLSRRRMMKRSMAKNFLILAWRFSSSCSTSLMGVGVRDCCSHPGRSSSPLPQAYRWPWSQRATEKSRAAATFTTLWFWKQWAGILMGTPVLAESSTPSAPAQPQAQTSPLADRARECLLPQERAVMETSGLSKESLRGSSESEAVDCPRRPSSGRPTVQTAWSLVTKPRWCSPVDTLTMSLKFCTNPGAQCSPVVGLPQPQVVSPQVSRWPVVEKLRFSSRESIRLSIINYQFNKTTPPSPPRPTLCSPSTPPTRTTPTPSTLTPSLFMTAVLLLQTQMYPFCLSRMLIS